MIYFAASILGPGEWQWRAREWALALEPLDMRLYSTDRAVLQRELFPKGHRNVLDLATRPPKASHCAIRFGAPQTLMNIDNRAPHEVAILDWWTDRLSPRAERVLKRYDQVWVPTEYQLTMLLGQGVNAAYIPDPVDLPAWEKAEPLEEHSGEILFYAIGNWGEPDRLEDAARAFHSAFTLEVPARLLLISPDCPLHTGEDLREWVGEGQSIGRCSIVHRHPLDPHELRGFHAMGDVYVDTHRCLGPSWQARLAAAAGSRIMGAKEPVPVEGVYGLYTAPQLWASSPPEELGKRLLGVVGAQIGVLVDKPLDRDEVLNRVVGALKDVSTDVEEPKPVLAGPQKKEAGEPSLCFVIPHRSRGPHVVERCLRQLRAMGGLGEQDRVVVVDQTEESELENVCEEYGATLVVDTEPPVAWNPARCRNQGVRAAPGADYYAPVDVDCLVPEGYAGLIRGELAQNPWEPVTPLVLFGMKDVGLDRVPWEDDWPSKGEEVPAPGMTVYPRHLWEEAHGMDEGFHGWGSEDTDLLWRILRGAGIQSRILEVAVYHCPHEPQKVKEESGPRNLERLNKRMAGELGPANVEGWGEGGKVVYEP